jgi:SWI/SNF-related matrix-associated actin-dependent regulator of chromatin subfamily A member 5
MVSKMETQFKFLRLDGATSRARRNLNLYLFNNDPVYQVFLIATRAGGEGITLTSATEVVFLDLDWNPQLTLQAEARVHRIGQTQPITVYKILTRGTVEEQMMSRLAKKLYLAAKITENIGNTVVQTGKQFLHFESSLLTSLTHRETQEIPCNDTNPEGMLSWKWHKIVEACSDRRTDHQNEADGEEGKTLISKQDAEKQWLRRLEKIETSRFNGVIIPRSADKIPAEEDILSILHHADRRIGKNRTVLIDGYHISKESLRCKDDEAVLTMAGKDPRFAEWKREKKAEFSHEKACLVCGKRSGLEKCQSCPRVFHPKCVENHHSKTESTSSFFPINRPLCPQHNCCTCHHTASEAGGMLFRCCSCHRAFCEGCLEWKMTTFIGDEISEWAVLGYAFSSSMYFVECEHCSQAVRKEEKLKKRKRNHGFIATLASKRPKRGVLSDC